MCQKRFGVNHQIIVQCDFAIAWLIPDGKDELFGTEFTVEVERGGCFVSIETGLTIIEGYFWHDIYTLSDFVGCVNGFV